VSSTLTIIIINYYHYYCSRVLSEARELTEFPNLNGTSALEVLRIDRASIYSIPDTLCTTCPKLKSLYVVLYNLHTMYECYVIIYCIFVCACYFSDIKWNRLSRIPNLNKCKELRVLWVDFYFHVFIYLRDDIFNTIFSYKTFLFNNNIMFDLYIIHSNDVVWKYKQIFVFS